MAKNNGLHQWFKDNLYAFIIVVAGAIITFAVMQQRLSVLEAKVNEYPSEDWFELKFENIDKRFTEIEKRIDDRVAR